MTAWTWTDLSQVQYQHCTCTVTNLQQVLHNAENSMTSCANISFSKGALFRGYAVNRWHLNAAELEEITIGKM
jgi:hypothetical protein